MCLQVSCGARSIASGIVSRLAAWQTPEQCWSRLPICCFYADLMNCRHWKKTRALGSANLLSGKYSLKVLVNAASSEHFNNENSQNMEKNARRWDASYPVLGFRHPVAGSGSSNSTTVLRTL